MYKNKTPSPFGLGAVFIWIMLHKNYLARNWRRRRSRSRFCEW